MNSLEKDGHDSPDTSERDSARLCALFNGATLLDIISFLSIKELFELSLCNKKLQQMLESYPMYWNKRAAIEFGVSLSEDAAVEAGMEQYFHKYNDWYEEQQSYLQGTMWEEETMNMLVKSDSVVWGRIIYLYETWIVFCGLPVTIVIFTILMMLYLTNVIHINVNFIYGISYLYMIVIQPFLIIPAMYIQANTKKEISPMWFLSNFNSNLIFIMIKSDFVTRTQKESKSYVKYISNNEVVFTNNAHYYLLLLQIWIVYFCILANLILFNLFQRQIFISKLPFVIVEWVFVITYGVVMQMKMCSTGIKRDDDKWECAYFYAVLIQWGLLTCHLLLNWPNLYFALLPTLIAIGGVCAMLILIFMGLLQINMNGVVYKRWITFVGIMASLFFLLFLIHVTDKFVRGKTRSSLLLCIEFMIPELCLVVPVGIFLHRTENHRPKVLCLQNYDLVHNHNYLRALVDTRFDMRSRLRQLMQTETRLLRYIICSQLFKSFIQSPSITESVFFPQIVQLIDELRWNHNPDILQAIRFLSSTGITFSPLLQCIITEMMEEEPVRQPREDIEAGLLENEERMHDGSVRGLPSLNPAVMMQPALEGGQTDLDVQLDAVIFSLLDEASVEDRFRRV